MHELIVELQKYHRTKLRHLGVLERYVGGMSEDDSRSEHAARIKVLFEPFYDTAEGAHHRNEEAILLELRKTSAPLHRRVEEISGDHDAFTGIIARISAQLDCESVGCAELRASILNFIAIYRDHAAGEESIFFPIADKYLGDAHWRRVRDAWK